MGGSSTDDVIDDFYNRDLLPEGASREDAADFVKNAFFQNWNQTNSRETAFADLEAYMENSEMTDSMRADMAQNAEDIIFSGRYKGVEFINEKDGKYIYTPGSYYCGLKAMCKFMGTDYKSSVGYATQGMKIPKLAEFWAQNTGRFKQMLKTNGSVDKQKLLETFYENTPPFFIVNTHKNELICIPECYEHKNSKLGKFLLTCYEHEWHMSFGKHVECEHGDMYFCNVHKYEIFEDMKVTTTRHLEIVSDKSSWKLLQRYKPRKYFDWVYAMDIETYTEKTLIKQKDGSFKNSDVLYPYSIQFQMINLHTREMGEMHVIETVDPMTHVMEITKSRLSAGGDLFDRMFEIMRQECLSKGLKRIQVYSHNGGKFDNIYAKMTSRMVFKSVIRNGSCHKDLELKTTLGSRADVTFNMRDSYQFLGPGMTLARAGEAFKIPKEYQKLSYDIGGKTYEDYQKDRSWYDYAVNDIHALREILFEMEKSYLVTGESITSHLGVPGIAWAISLKSCQHLRNTYVPKDPSLVELISNATFGGRVQVYKFWSYDQICLDMTSLYPTAMLNTYPIGIPHAVGSDFDPRTERHYIITAKIQAPNIPHAIHPHRTSKGRVIYPSNTYFEGSYTDVELKEMMKDGYIVHEIVNGICWNDKAYIFKDYIEYLYQMRKQFKKEGNVQEVVTKLELNSSWGKLRNRVTSVCEYPQIVDREQMINYVKKEVGKGVKKCNGIERLRNGQFEVSFSLGQITEDKPLHLAAFVLSYARATVNKVIRMVGIKHISYTDTDSLYIHKPRFDELMAGEDVESKTFNSMFAVEGQPNDNLGTFKNDYGPDVIIKEMIALDQKRYLLIFGGKYDGLSKAKFCGMTFRDGYRSSQINKKFFDKETTIKLKSEYLQMEKNYFDFVKSELSDSKDHAALTKLTERWTRHFCHVSIDYKELEYRVDTRCKYTRWGNIAFSIGFELGAPEYKSFDDYMADFNYDLDEPISPIRETITKVNKQRAFLDLNNFTRSTDGKMHCLRIPHYDMVLPTRNPTPFKLYKSEKGIKLFPKRNDQKYILTYTYEETSRKFTYEDQEMHIHDGATKTSEYYITTSGLLSPFPLADFDPDAVYVGNIVAKEPHEGEIPNPTPEHLEKALLDIGRHKK